MKLLLILIVIFLAVLYIYTYIKHKKKRKNKIDAVGDYRRNYLEKDFRQKPDNNGGYSNYITKYNSSVDYIDKEEFFKENSESESPQKPSRKKLQF